MNEIEIRDHIDCGATSYEEAFEKFGLPSCADEWLELVCDIAFDYDGYKTVEGLKELIDEMVEYVKNARKCMMQDRIFKR